MKSFEQQATSNYKNCVEIEKPDIHNTSVTTGALEFLIYRRKDTSFNYCVFRYIIFDITQIFLLRLSVSVKYIISTNSFFCWLISGNTGAHCLICNTFYRQLRLTSMWTQSILWGINCSWISLVSQTMNLNVDKNIFRYFEQRVYSNIYKVLCPKISWSPSTYQK